jgi:peptide/nickel transport system substrate-binding protein
VHTPFDGERRAAEELASSFLAGAISRRQLFARAGKLSAGAVAMSALGGVLAACGGKGSGGTTTATGGTAQKAGGTLKAALTGEPDSLDPNVSQIYTGAQVYDNIFSKLIDIGSDQQFYGVLATKWTQTDDTTWTFDLVPNATFHNGEKFTANDVKYTFERLLDPKTASGYAPLYTVIDAVEVASPTQAIFHLKSPFGPFLTNLANNGEIVNQKAIESGKDPARNPVGTGPFQFVEWAQGDHVTLKAFPGYFQKDRPFLDGVEFRFLPVDQGRVDALASGELDWSDAIPLQQLATLKTDPRFHYVTSALAGIPDYLAMNVSKPPFDNKALRQAVAWALDRDEIRNVAYFGAGETGSEEVPTGSKWYDGQDPYAAGPDLDKAKAKMQEAGLANGITVEYLGLPQYPELLKTGEVVQQQLKQIGINMQIKQVDVSVWFDHFSKGTYDITSAYQERTIDPDNFYSLVLKTGAPINATQYANPAFDKMIDQAARETDEATRKTLYQQLRQIVFDDVPLIFAHYETLNYLMRKEVVGSTINPTLELRLENVSMS